ncbi:MAG: DNA cytosine methyltransferase [Candidatus Caldarchaeum sp.]
MELCFVDLFAAPGGFSLGCEMAGFRCLGGVDMEPKGMSTYSHNLPRAKPIVADMRTLDGHTLMRELELSEGELDLLVGGPPCQGFSTIGRVKIASLVKSGLWDWMAVSEPRFIDDPRNILYREFIRLVRKLKPKFVIMENVAGMLSYRNGETIHQIKEDFVAAGYRVEARVLNALHFGVPQKRKRIFFIANRLGLPNVFPRPTHRHPEDETVASLDEFLEGEFLKKAVTVRDAIGDLPEIEAGGGAEVMDYSREPFSEYQRWARKNSSKVYNHAARPHSERDKRCFAFMKEGMWWKDLPDEIKQEFGFRDDIFHDKLKKLVMDRPSWTIVSHLYKDGYMYIHPAQPRTVTVREAARLQSFPDTFRFMGSRTAQFKQVGNAVPPLLAKAVAETILSILLQHES